MSPSSQAFSMMPCGHVPSRSYSHATGRISFSAKSCAISRRAFCSSVRVKSTMWFCVSWYRAPAGDPVKGAERRQIDWSVSLPEEGPYDDTDRHDEHDGGEDHERPLEAPDRRARRGHGPAAESAPHGWFLPAGGGRV